MLAGAQLVPEGTSKDTQSESEKPKPELKKDKDLERKIVKGPDYFKSVRTMVLLLWTLSNVSAGFSVS